MAEQQLDLEALKADISEKAGEAVGRACEFARERPHLAVGIAFGVGWVLGNGLPPRLLLGVARLGWKAALGGMLASSGLAGLMGEAEGDGASERGPTTAVRQTQPEVGARPRGGSTI